jgi:hypothetical protein
MAMRLTIAEGTKSVAGLLLWSAGHVVMEAASGKAISLLSWFEGQRGYQLWVDANVVRVPLRERMRPHPNNPCKNHFGPSSPVPMRSRYTQYSV